MTYTDLHLFQIQISNGRSQRSNFSNLARCTLMRDRHLYIYIYIYHLMLILCFSCPIHSSSIHQKSVYLFNLESASSRCCNGLSQPYQERTPNSLQEEQDPRKHYQCCNGRCSQSSSVCKFFISRFLFLVLFVRESLSLYNFMNRIFKILV